MVLHKCYCGWSSGRNQRRRTAQFESSDIPTNAWNKAGTTNGALHSRSTSLNARSARTLLALSARNSSSNRKSSVKHTNTSAQRQTRQHVRAHRLARWCSWARGVRRVARGRPGRLVRGLEAPSAGDACPTARVRVGSRRGLACGGRRCPTTTSSGGAREGRGWIAWGEVEGAVGRPSQYHCQSRNRNRRREWRGSRPVLEVARVPLPRTWPLALWVWVRA